ncbi:MAG: ABC transporter permease [Bacteroidales bacterium]|nr:ABC transporter permease [Bacteroidales bacterium]
MRYDRDTLTEILDTLTRNKSRSLLTAFGVFWGIFMLVILSGGSNGLEKMLWAQFNGFATNSGFAYTNNTSLAYKGFRKGRGWYMEQKDVDAIRENVKGIDVITGCNSQWNRTVIYKDLKYNDCTLKGLEPCYDKIEPQMLLYGRFINEIDIRETRKVCVLGKTVYESLFEKGEDPCGKFISIDDIKYNVVGVSGSESQMSINGQTSESVEVPMTTLRQAYNHGNVIDVLCYTAMSGYKVSDVEKDIASLLKAAHYVHPDDKKAVGQINAEELFEIVETVFIGLGILTWMVGLGTLIAGIIGVSNIMMVTVRERTSEIGIRRAIGARPTDILQQIIAECILLTMTAGLMGLSAGVGLLNLADTLIKTDAGSNFGFGISLQTGIAITIIVALLGVVAAMAPALRAMAIKPIEAMREE